MITLPPGNQDENNFVIQKLGHTHSPDPWSTSQQVNNTKEQRLLTCNKFRY